MQSNINVQSKLTLMSANNPYKPRQTHVSISMVGNVVGREHRYTIMFEKINDNEYECKMGKNTFLIDATEFSSLIWNASIESKLDTNITEEQLDILRETVISQATKPFHTLVL